jgi:hypothetical protein
VWVVKYCILVKCDNLLHRVWQKPLWVSNYCITVFTGANNVLLEQWTSLSGPNRRTSAKWRSFLSPIWEKFHMFYRKSIDWKKYKCYLLDLPKSHKPEKTKVLNSDASWFQGPLVEHSGHCCNVFAIMCFLFLWRDSYGAGHIYIVQCYCNVAPSLEILRFSPTLIRLQMIIRFQKVSQNYFLGSFFYPRPLDSPVMS